MKKGFTLIELLIVIGIVAILSVVVLITLNPAELLRQARDSTRLADLNSIKTALALYLVDATTPSLGTTAQEAQCRVHSGITGDAFGAVVGCDPDGATAVFKPRFAAGTPDKTGNTLVTGTGWITVDLATLPNGAPISAYPIDPVNKVGTSAGSDLFYAWRFSGLTYEINANLESSKFIGQETTDGGNANAAADAQGSLYEIGTDSGLDL